MAFDKTLKIRVNATHIEKAEKDSELLGKNVSEHVRDLIVDFEVVRGGKIDDK